MTAPIWTLLHVRGCGKPCVRRIGRPVETDPITAELHRHLDGSQVLPTDLVVCESCGAQLSPQAGDTHPDHWIEGDGL
jgi:hypothetical protein